MTILLFFITLPVFSQTGSLNQKRNNLNQIRKDINLYESRYKKESLKEANILDMLSKLDREIDLTHVFIEELKKEEEKQSKAIIDVAHTIKDKREEINRLKEIYKARLVNFYKHGRRKDIELLLTAKSFNQVLLWLKYQKLLASNDRRNYNNLLEKTQTIEDEKERLKQELLTSRKILKEKDIEERKLQERKQERKILLEHIRKNKDLYLKKLQEYEISAKEIERLINIEEKRRKNKKVESNTQVTDFPSLKGKMIWPTKGQIIVGFGQYTHPTLKTVTESIGIDIEAKYGAEVRVVCDGIVTAITWQRGRGNIIIVSHFGGYYTVYTHLSNIYVQINSEVKIGQAIGEVGDSGSLKGSMLHFEIWLNNKVLNPEQWLG